MNAYLNQLMDKVKTLPKDLQDEGNDIVQLFLTEVEMGESIDNEFELAWSDLNNLTEE